MIQVRKYVPSVFEHFDNEGNSLGLLNEYESTDLRAQIAEENVSGYYLIFNGLSIPIESDGRINNWVDGLYDINEKLIARIFKVQSNNYKNRNHDFKPKN